MKSILISIKPKWCELIANRKKTIEVRKTKPKLDTPFKCYIYCTKQGRPLVYGSPCPSYVEENLVQTYGYSKEEAEEVFGCWNGKVIGEFVCDCITPLFNVCTDKWDYLVGGLHKVEKELVSMASLTEAELYNYANGSNCYAWHLSDLVIYDEPKKLSEYINCKYPYDCFVCDYWDNKYTICTKPIRPPQSWCYVEERET